MPTKRKIIDAHHHLWDLDVVHYPWLMAKGVKRFFGDPTPIQKNYMPDDLRHDAREYDLLGSVHIQVGAETGQEIRETEWLAQRGDSDGLPSAIVAFADLSAADAQAVLGRQAQFARVRGIRQIVGRSEEEDARSGTGGLLHDARWLENLATLQEHGLSFDLQLIPSQVPRVTEILSNLPDLRVALCHCGSPWDQSASGLSSWRQGLQLLAAQPNVHCKISGLGMFNHAWDVDSIRPVVESCIDIFGVERSMFASNFPVDKLHGSYSSVWGAFEEIAAEQSAADQENLFSANAARFYEIDLSED